MTTNTEKLLSERKTTHGEYSEHARCCQRILEACMAERNWSTLPPIVRETLHMWAHKMGRIATGNPYMHEHYNDVSGYSLLVVQRTIDGVGLRPEHDFRTLDASWSRGNLEPREPGTPEDGGHHATAEAVADEEQRLVPRFPAEPLPDGGEAARVLEQTARELAREGKADWVDEVYRRNLELKTPLSTAEVDDIIASFTTPVDRGRRYPLEVNSSERRELPLEAQVMYVWFGDAGKWIMLEEFRAEWARGR